MHRRIALSAPSIRRLRLPLTAVAVAALLMAPAAADAATVPDQWEGGLADGGSTSTNAGEHVITAANAAKVTTAWHSTDGTTTPTAPVVTGGVVYRLIAGTSTTFTATSVRSGVRLWSLALPTTGSYFPGMTAAGSKVLVAFNGAQSNPGGVLAIDTTTKRVAWRSVLPAATLAGDSNQTAGTPVTDGTRVYLSGASNSINAYAVSTGTRQWSVPLALNTNGTIAGTSTPAAVGGVVYTSGQQGLVARDAATGAKRWASKAATTGIPVVAGGRVLVSTGDDQSVQAYPAAGCGAASCSPTWTRAVTTDFPSYLTVNAADASSLFVTWRTSRPGGPGTCTSGFIGHVARLGASTGSIQWTVSVGASTAQLIRGGSTIWLYDDYVTGDCSMGNRILGYSATATGSTPLKQIPLTTVDSGYPQALAIAGGTLLQQTWIDGLIGYRVPGT